MRPADYQSRRVMFFLAAVSTLISFAILYAVWIAIMS
jgi:hypothetical protein